VTILGWLFIVAGVVGLGFHLSERPLDRWVALISFIRVLAIVVGVFLLKGRNWLVDDWVAWLSRWGERITLAVGMFGACSVVPGGGLFPADAAGFPVFSGFATRIATLRYS
jgi:formate hydrogenlyase subunit 3/multisubunit Na+/H+ antiporter MnhD subunit